MTVAQEHGGTFGEEAAPPGLGRLLRPFRDPRLTRFRPNPTLSLVLRLVFGVAAFVTAFRAQMLLEDRKHLGAAVAYLIVATIFVALATVRQRIDGPVLDPAESKAATEPRRYRRAALVWVALAVIAVGVGIAFRVYELPSNPPGVWFDEAQNGIIAERILDDSSYRPVFITGYEGTNRPALPAYVFAAGEELLGRNILALRSVSTLAGLLTVVALFFLGRELFGLRVAALAAFLLAVMRWHLDFSRFAMEPIWAPFFLVSGMLFLVKGVQRGRWYHFALSGLLLGLGLHFYWAFLLTPLLYAVYMAHSFLARQSAKLTRLALGALLVVVVAFVAYSPVAVYGYQHPQEYEARANTLNITKGKNLGQIVQAVEKTTKAHVLMFNSAGSANAAHNIPGAPMLDTFTGIFFVLGLGICLSRLWQPRYMLLVAWMVILLQPAIWFSEAEAPQALRSILVIPAVALLAALPLAALSTMVEDRIGLQSEHWAGIDWRRSPKRLAGILGRSLTLRVVAVVILVFLALIAYENFHTYFDKQLRRFDVWNGFSTGPTLTAEEMNRLGPDYDFFMSSAFVDQPSLRFLRPEAGDGSQYSLDVIRDMPTASDKPTAVFLDPDRDGYIPWLQTLYPDAVTKKFTAPGDANGAAGLYEILISKESEAAIRGIDASYSSPGTPLTTRREPDLDLDWTSQTPLAPPFDAVFSGVVQIREPNTYDLQLQAPGEIQLSLDGQLLARGSNMVEAPRYLYKGEHMLEVSVHVEGPGAVRLLANGAPLPEGSYFVHTDAGNGLLGSYYANDSFSGEPTYQELDPFIGFAYHAELPFNGPFSVIWRGKVEAPVAGQYSFVASALGKMEVRVDGQLVATNDSSEQPDITPPYLSEGLHDIEVRFAGGERVWLAWVPPSGSEELITSKYLFPR